MLLHELVIESAESRPEAEALRHKGRIYPYSEIALWIRGFAGGLLQLGLKNHERVGVYLPKQAEAVVSYFGTSLAGGVFVPINPLLKPEQVKHILCDSGARILVTTQGMYNQLFPMLGECKDIRSVVLIDRIPNALTSTRYALIDWESVISPSGTHLPKIIDDDIVSLLYTSGSTGKPKGVILSHRNMVAGAWSVSEYLQNSSDDVLLAILPFSFDYGFSQLSTAFAKGACVVLLEYLLPNDVLKTAAQEKITGLAAVPPVWIRLAKLVWPDRVKKSLRYITNSGGTMPVTVTKALQKQLPNTQIYLMYGLTEAFRSTFLSPDQIEKRPDSIGKAIPNADILVLDENGSPCKIGEVGELVHRGALVSKGYWNDPDRTEMRFRPIPLRISGLPFHEIAVWSGDRVRMDGEGYLFFVGREDEMIKTSGYRVSPSEVEEVIYELAQVGELAVLGVPHPVLGQAILLIACPKEGAILDEETIKKHCIGRLPDYMIPLKIVLENTLPRNPNGKIDRVALKKKHWDHFTENQN